jgi:type I restriction enzyme M protein
VPDKLAVQRVKLPLGSVDVTTDPKGRVVDFATAKRLGVLSKCPEEPVRQWYEEVLVQEHGFGKGQIDVEVPVRMGSSTKKADIVVYETSAKSKKVIIVETKKPKKKEGVAQLQSYLEATGTEIGAWTNGADISLWYHPSPQSYEPLGRLVNAGETVDDIGATKLRSDLRPAADLVADFRAAEQYILAHQGGVDV